jgi:glycosyltransferase involved in cell wall biosynthesis
VRCDVIVNILQPIGIACFSYIIPNRYHLLYYFRQAIFLIRFCRRQKIDIIYSHLEPTNLVAVIAQFVTPTKVYVCRHHIDEGRLYRFDRDWIYRLTYRLAKRIIVVSAQAKQYMTTIERIPASKIIPINLAYDYSLYTKVDLDRSTQIRLKYRADILLITICRLTHHKHPGISISIAKRLHDSGLNVSLIILGRGELTEKLRERIKLEKADKYVHLLGHVENVLDYLSVADFLLHPSQLESSCVVVKEAGLVKRPVIVCRGIGDFNDYLVHEVNAFVVSRESYIEDSIEIIKQYVNRKKELKTIGENLHTAVMSRFDINNVLALYDDLNVS